MKIRNKLVRFTWKLALSLMMKIEHEWVLILLNAVYFTLSKLRSIIQKNLFNALRWTKAIDVSERLGKIYLKVDNRHGFHRQALSTVILVLAFGDEVDASKRMDVYAE
jgi:hypothetical protein